MSDRAKILCDREALSAAINAIGWCIRQNPNSPYNAAYSRQTARLWEMYEKLTKELETIAE